MTTLHLAEHHSARFSVVIPAHNEGVVIERCLSFVRDLREGEADVVVVANGCTDDTGRRARSLPGVRVLELTAAGKAAALNAGDRFVQAFPRIYLDADVVVSANALRQLAVALEQPRAAVAAPRAVLVTESSSPGVRLFFHVYRCLPYLTMGMVGSGVYALNAAGRARFDTFRDVAADDLYVQRLFAPDETVILDDVTFEVHVPRTLRSLVAVRTRIARGNAELARVGGEAYRRSTQATVRKLVSLVAQRPTLLLPAAVYVGVTLLARLRARGRGRRAHAWERDDTSRVPGCLDRSSLVHEASAPSIPPLVPAEVAHCLPPADRRGRVGREDEQGHCYDAIGA